MANPNLNNGQSYLPSTGQGKVNQWHGTYAASVISNADPNGKGALQVQVPQVSGTATTTWAPPYGPYSTIPTPGQQVSVVYLGGDVTYPMWIWNEEITGSSGTTGTEVVYSPSAPESPSVGEVWYPQITTDGTTSTGTPEVWTYDADTSTYSWVPQGTIAGTAITPSTITGELLADGAVTTSSLAAGAVSAANIADGAVVAGTIAPSAVSAETIADNAITTVNIQPNSISTPLLQTGAVTAEILEAGIVVAGIVDSTEILTATLIGTDSIINANGIVFYKNPI